ncbi:MAG: hypothetical protein II897_03795 [Clostridia bacterium]|nr:hypothetical protein [Clostridia bacterium]
MSRAEELKGILKRDYGIETAADLNSALSKLKIPIGVFVDKKTTGKEE